MKMKTLASVIVTAVTAMFLSCALIYPQSSKTVTSELAVSPGSLYLVDGRAGLANSRPRCGPASPDGMNPVGGTFGLMGPFVKLDLSFGYLPFSRLRSATADPFSPSESFIGTWTVRNITPPDGAFPESVSLIHFNGRLTSGLISPMRGGTTGFELYGITTFTNDTCGIQVKREAYRIVRRYLRIAGTCGTDQDLTFQIGERPPVDRGGYLAFADADLFISGTFKGNITCRQTTDRREVRTNLN